MKRKNNLLNILDKIDLWKHCFGDIWDYDSLEKVVSTFDIVGIKRKLSVEESLKLKWIKKDNCYLNEAIDCFTTHPCVYIDLSKPSGHSIIAITAPLQYSKNTRQEIYDRNVARMARLREEVQQGQRSVADYFFQRVENGIRNFESRERNQRRQRRGR